MSAYLLIVILFTGDQIPLGLYSTSQRCIETAGELIEQAVIQDEHDLWCVPVEIKDGYANIQE